MPMTKILLDLASKGDPEASSTQSDTSVNNILSIHATTTTTTTILRPPGLCFRDYPGEPVPER